jgi:hypothetical protein
LVRATLAAVQPETDPRTSDLIRHLLKNDPKAIQKEIWDLRPRNHMPSDWGQMAH